MNDRSSAGESLLPPVGLRKKEVERLSYDRQPRHAVALSLVIPSSRHLVHRSVLKDADPSTQTGAPAQAHRADPVSQELLHPIHFASKCDANGQIHRDREQIGGGQGLGREGAGK